MIRTRDVLAVVSVGLLTCSSGFAGSRTFTFDTDPRNDAEFIITSNVSDPVSGLDFYEGTGGNPATGGYIAVTRSARSQSSQILFPDFDAGLVVKAFTFECDLRLGNPTGQGGRPADGFSINYARAGDPAVNNLLNNPTSTDTSQYAVSGGPENGTKTGIAISFDTWAGNALPDGADVEGIIVRVDNVTVQRYALPTRNGACSDITSLQTGPYDAAADAAGTGGAYDGLCWAKLRVELADTGELTVMYKGATLLDKFQTGYAPSAGRILVAGRTGDANENNHLDNLVITTVAADRMLIGNVTGNAYGFQFKVNDSGPSVLNPATLVVTYDDVVVTPTTVSKPAGATETLIDYQNLATRLDAGSSHTLVVTANDTAGNTVTRTQTYTIPAYTLVPPAWRVAGTPTTPGLKARTHMIDETLITGFTFRYGDPGGNANRASSAEMQFAEGYVDPELLQPYPNSATAAASDLTVANWNQWDYVDPTAGVSLGDIDANNPDNFNSVEPTGAPVPNDPIPGIDPSSYATPDNVVVEAVAYVELKRGLVRMGVNSDDGFKVSVAPGQPSVTGLTLGLFDDGRGATDTTFDFVVDQDGFYPMRLLWWEGDGGANCEWFTVDRLTGQKTLVNASTPAAAKAFRTGAGRAVLQSAMPSNGWQGGRKAAGIHAVLVDGSTTVVDGSIRLFVGGKDVTAQATIVNGATTTVTFRPAGVVDWGWPDPNWRLEWTESTTPPTTWTQDFTFRLAPDDLPANGSFWIEAEDWNYQNGQHVAAASTMPYQGGAYDGLAGVLNVDYFDDQNEATDSGVNFTYRTDQRPNHADINATTDRFALDRPGAVDLTTDYKIGWVGNFWGNYTRTIPAGVYKAYAALSIDNSNNDGTRADLDRVVSGASTPSQTLERLGTFYGRGNGGYGRNELAPLRDAYGREAVFQVAAGDTTLRVTALSGDFDWFVLVPTTSPARLRSAPPIGTAAFSVPQTLRWVFEDFDTTINTATATLKIDGQTVPAAQFPVTKTGKVTTASYVLELGKVTGYEFSVQDSAGTTLAYSGTVIGNHFTPSPAHLFLIEGEDFNTGGGQVQAAANAMPYTGNAYAGLSATAGVDYGRTDNEASGDIYRTGESPNVPFSSDGDVVRARDAAGAATWSVTANYRLGWSAGGRWMNYTREIPAGNYQVWASMAHGDGITSGTQVHGVLSRVTSDPTQPDQTVEPIGYFRGPATGGWGVNQLFPLRLSADDTTSDAAVVTLGGTTASTLRFEYISGDMDYFMLVPSTESLAPVMSIPVVQPDGKVVLSWTGGGVLQVAPTVNGPWTDQTGVTSPYTWTPGTATEAYARVKQ